ncbi:glycosyltransferase [Lentilactobacillus otakiensis]|uniref:Poly-beta-1,6 N-acetyl-D-glucosamine synthase n=1 Tax=Lentilactobacillus otakiensis DSM 19908 = JCM 15040 TaxID=1423780 RepID=S4PQE7_9LACO|nr:glycosyltransferase family 2 protein [Lentilactobacillus otakiensis]KRL12105.1 poly-beta-1,6 N-acetyl-D-glucosamine synthase [Lentilactobacillus otakiensis DSM 19908 = JCM 15040]MBZ3777553.1 glycosyltransferase [Lentilactobacillus otakiensis]MDV3517448.1 glycosyltransferase [Lentilactobacillus otakiensis]GAD17150.1 poly-beta-1,6 N-acetyl-D-glucosamine synthase [Lentilactobacillus otakiensis DSM 19908 = JCM 15040]
MDTISSFVILYPVIVSTVWIVGSIFFAIQQHRVPLNNAHAGKPDALVSVLIPAHNEEETLDKVVESVARLTYAKLELILINDGSTDQTVRVMRQLAEKYGAKVPIRIVDIKKNQGKANALNEGAKEARGEFLLCLDADCYVDKNALEPMMARFYDNPKVGAVGGKPIVRNRTSLLGRLQLLEYVGVIDIIKRGQAFVTGHITTVSGVVVAYRKSALADAGWWNTDAITEDIDITWRLYHHGWQVAYCPLSVAWILVPERIVDLVHQRRRWARGGFEVLYRNRGMLVTGRLSEQWLLMDMILSDLWALSCAFVTLFYLITVAFTGDLIMDGVILFLLLLISLIQFLIGYADSKKSDFITWHDLLLLPLYVIFYWFINLVSCLTALGSFFLDPRHVGSWSSPDRGL